MLVGGQGQDRFPGGAILDGRHGKLDGRHVGLASGTGPGAATIGHRCGAGAEETEEGPGGPKSQNRSEGGSHGREHMCNDRACTGRADRGPDPRQIGHGRGDCRLQVTPGSARGAAPIGQSGGHRTDGSPRQTRHFVPLPRHAPWHADCNAGPHGHRPHHPCPALLRRPLRDVPRGLHGRRWRPWARSTGGPGRQGRRRDLHRGDWPPGDHQHRRLRHLDRGRHGGGLPRGADSRRASPGGPHPHRRRRTRSGVRPGIEDPERNR